MAPTRESCRTVFRQIAQQSYVDWPTYNSSLLFDRTSLPGVESDVRLVAETWFRHDDHNGVDQFVHAVPLAYVQFDPHDRYAGSTSYEMETLFRLFLLKECHGWDHETALVEYLTKHPDLCEQIGLESVPNQSTLWRSWHHRFTADLQDTVETAARTILIKAQNAGVTVPREPDRQSLRYGDENTDSNPDDQTILKQAQTVTERVSDVAFPAGIVAIDITESDPFTGNRAGHEDEIIGTKEKADEYAYQWATVQLVGNAVPIVLDARPVRKGDTRKEIVEDLLDSAEAAVHVDNVLMDREFDSQHILEMLSQRGLSYVVPKRMQTSEKAQAKRLLKRGKDRYETDRKLHLGNNEWHSTTLIYRRKEDSEHTDHR